MLLDMIKSALIAISAMSEPITDCFDHYFINLLGRLVRPHLKRMSEP